MEFWVARGGSIAALAVAFATYASQLTHRDGEWEMRWVAFVMVVALTVVNYLGVRWGGAVQVIFTGTKVAAIGALVACAFGLPGGSPANWQPFWAPPGGEVPLAAIGGAMIASLWAYDGWANGAAVSEEMKDPQRNAPRALQWGSLLDMGLYLLANVAYHYVLPMAELARQERVAARVAEVLLGPVGAGVVAAAVMVSTFGATNGLLLTGPRIFYAMARDRVFFRELAELHVRFRTPYLAIFFQGLWAAFLILLPFNTLVHRLFGTRLETPLFDQLITFVIFGSWLFYGMTVAGVMVLRRTRPDLERPYRAWGYPLVPALFVLTSAAFVLHTAITQPWESAAGLGLLALGLPAYWRWSRPPGAPGAAVDPAAGV